MTLAVKFIFLPEKSARGLIKTAVERKTAIIPAEKEKRAAVVFLNTAPPFNALQSAPQTAATTRRITAAQGGTDFENRMASKLPAKNANPTVKNGLFTKSLP